MVKIIIAMNILHLILADYNWIPLTFKDEIPVDAFLGGTGYAGDKPYLIYIGRANHMSEIIPGKVSVPNRSGFFQCVHNDEKVGKHYYEILVGTDDFSWIKMTSEDKFPSNAIKGGQDKNGAPYYIGRAKQDGRNYEIGKIDSTAKILNTNIFDELKNWTKYEILVWQNTCTSPLTANNTDRSIIIENNDTKYPTAEYRWEPLNSDEKIPNDAVFGGTHEIADENKIAKLYIGRARRYNELIPCKVVSPNSKNNLNGGNCYVLHNRTEEEDIYQYEILAGPDEFSWRKMNSEWEIPKNAVVGGEKDDGTPYYIGRAKYDKRNKNPGKVDGSNKNLYLSLFGMTKTFDEYEILVWGRKC